MKYFITFFTAIAMASGVYAGEEPKKAEVKKGTNHLAMR